MSYKNFEFCYYKVLIFDKIKIMLRGSNMITAEKKKWIHALEATIKGWEILENDLVGTRMSIVVPFESCKTMEQDIEYIDRGCGCGLE